MKLQMIGIMLVGTLLLGCSSEEFISTDEALAQMPVIHGLGIPIQDIPVQHAIQPKLFNEFGLEINGSEGDWKYLAHPEFFMPVDQVISAVSNGVVRDVVQLGGSEDQLIMVTPDDAPNWTIGYEHVRNVMVTRGQRVSIGDPLAQMSPENQTFMPGYGKTALMVFVDNGGDNLNLSYCPFMLLDESVRQDVFNALNTHVQQWETNKASDAAWDGRENEYLFGDDAWITPGCAMEYMFV